MSSRFFEVARSNTRAFQEQLFYPYVSDRDALIGKNKLVRFYETITPYWLTQINEIVIVVLIVAVAAYRWFGPDDLSYRTSLLTSAIVLAAVFVLNRFWARSCLKKVRRATIDEIDAIILDHKPDLGTRLTRLCNEFSIAITNPPLS